LIIFYPVTIVLA